MRPPTILCADDERSVLLTLRDQLQRHFPDCIIEIAKGGAEALELIDELMAAGVEVPLVIADQIMPTMRGDELLVELHRRHPESLKVMLSGQPCCEELSNAVNGANLYRSLSKPWNEADLQQIVDEALRCYRHQCHLRQQQSQLEQANRELAAANADLRRQLQSCRQELQRVQQCSQPGAALQASQERASQERDRTILSAMPDIMTVISADGHYLDVCFNQFSGQVMPLQLGASLSDVLPPAAAQDCLAAIQRAIQTGEIQTHEQQIPLGDRIQYEEVRIVPFQPDRVLCMVRDVTERKQTELQLQQATAELDRFFSVSLDLFCIASLDGYFLRLNPAWERILGYSLEELQSRQFLEFVHPDDRASTLETIAELADDQAIPAFVNRYRHRDGSYRWIEWRSIPVGEVIYAAARDITARKQAETQLQESERRLSMALAAAKAGVWEWDILTNQTYWSDENFRLMGYEPGAVQTTYEVWLQAVHPEDQDWVDAHISQVVAEDRELNLEYRVLLADGSVRWLSDIGQIVKDDQGRPIRMNGIQIDITERKRGEREILQSRDLREAIFHESADALFLVDPQTLLTLDCNKRAVEMFEADQKQSLVNIEGHVLQARPFTDAELEQITGKLAEKGFWSLEVEYITLRGRRFWGNIAANQINVAGQLLNLVRVTDISERKQAEATVALVQAQQRSILENIPGYVAKVARDGEILFLNRTAPGFSMAEVVGRRLDEFTAPESQQIQRDALEQVFSTGAVVTIETLGAGAYGSPAYYEVRLAPLYRHDQVEAAIMVTTDVTARKQAELALRQSEAKQRALISALPDLIMRISADGVYLDFFAPNTLNAIGKTGDFIGTRVEESLPPDLAEKRMQAIRTALRTGTLQVYEQEIVANGVLQIEECRVVVCAPNEVLVIGRNISDRKRAEQALQQLNEELELRVQQRTQDLLASQLQLQAKEQFLRGVFEGTGNPIFVVDVLEDDRFAYTGWNRACEMISEVSTVDALGKSPHQLFPGAVGEAMACNYQRCIATGETIRYEEYLTFEQGDAWTLTTLTPLKDAAGRVHRIIGSAFDISERKRAEIALQEAQRFTQSIADNTPNIIYIYDLEHSHNLYMNREVFQVLGYTPAAIQAMGAKVLETVMHPDDLAALSQTKQRIRQLADGQILEVEYRMRHIDGTWRWLYDRISVFKRNASGGVVQYIGTAQDITDRKQAEAAVAEKNAILQSVIESTPDVVYVKDAQGRYVIANSGFIEFFGRPADQILGKTDADLLPAATVAQIEQNDRQTIQSGVPHTIEEIVPDADGNPRVYLTTKSPWRIPPGDQIGLVGLARDITERKQAEQALFESEQRYATLAAAVPVGIYRTSPSGDCLYVNERWCQIAGLTAPEALGTGWLKALYPEDRELIAQSWSQFVQTGIPFRLEYRFQRPDGTITWVFGQAIQELDESSQVKGYVGTITDISDRKQAEAQLREQEQFLRSIYEGVQQPMFVGDVLPDNQIRVASWNPVTARLMGMSNEEIAGKAVEELFPPDQAAEMLARYAQSIATRQPATFEECITFQGQTRWMLSTYNPLINSEGRVHRVVGTVYDITERKQLEQELRQINAELEQRVADRTQDLQQAMEAAQTASRAKTAFLANMSHELRTPLNAILGFSQLLHRDRMLTLDQQEQIKIINRSGEHLLSLINDVLAMSKIEAGQTSLTSSRFNLRDLLRDLEALFQLKAEAKQLHLTVQINAQVPRLIQTDESKLRQILINLVGNAIKFTERGSVAVRVWPEEPLAQTASEPASALSLHFEVEDTGFGIVPEEQALVFEPFGQTQSGRNSQEGTGLGLPISRQFVQLMGGDLGFTSIPNQGTRFYFTIPVEPAKADESSTDRSARVMGLATGQPRYRLLVVEDKSDSRQFLVQLLRSVGFEVEAAVNGQEAIELWQTWAPDLIWMDMRLPVMDGYRATKQIRWLEQQAASGTASGTTSGTTGQPTAMRPATKILALTASAFEDGRAPILAAGCDDILSKPVTEAVLFEKIAQHLGVRYLYQEEVVPPAAPEPSAAEAALDLRGLPLDWVAQLRYAARRADEELILNVIDQLPTSAAQLADRLRELVENLQIEQLLELTADSDESLT